MSKKAKTLIGALAVIVVLVGAYFGAGAWQKKKAAEAPAPSSFSESPRLSEFDSELINRIELPLSGIVLEKTGETWELESPQKNGVVLDQTAVSGKLWYMGNLRADSTVEEAPSDISQYGLDNPQGRAIITDSQGKQVELIFGDMTPGREAYYAMVKGDPKVYTVFSYGAENFLFSLDSIRKKDLLPEFDPVTLTRFVLEKGDEKIDLALKEGDDYRISSFSSFVINSPYKVPRGADSEKFGEVQQAMPGLKIGEFIDDEPASLAPYGLERPGRLYIESPGLKLDLNFGFGEDGNLYAKLAGADSVFTVPGLETVINTDAFTIADKFLMIFHIDSVEGFTVAGEGHNILAEISGTKDEPDFFIDGRKAADKEFRNYYQAVIGLLADAEYSGDQGRTAEGPGITITFNLKEPAGASSSIRLVPYNRDFYSVEQSGITEFLLSRSQVANIFDSASKMVYAE